MIHFVELIRPTTKLSKLIEYPSVRAKICTHKLDEYLRMRPIIFSHNIVFLGQASIRWIKLSTRTNLLSEKSTLRTLNVFFKNSYWLSKNWFLDDLRLIYNSSMHKWKRYVINEAFRLNYSKGSRNNSFITWKPS